MPLDGTWNIVTKTPMGEQKSVLVVTTSGDELAGTMTGSAGEVQVNDGEVDGDEVSWSIDATAPFPMTIAFTGTIDGDSISGKAKPGSFPATTFSGTRAASAGANT